MKDGAKTKEPLIDKMNLLHQRIVDSEKTRNESERIDVLLKESHDKIEHLTEERSAKFHMITSQLMEEIDNCKRIENQLRRSEERYKHIYENIQDIYYEISIDGVILELSPSIERLTKYQRIELVGKSVYELYAFPEEREDFLKIIKEQGMVNDYEIMLKDQDGQLSIWSLCSKIVFDDKAIPHKIIGTMRDITKRKQDEESLRESEERYKGVVENIGIGIALISPNMEILTLNNQMKKWFPDINEAKKPICYKAFNAPPRASVCPYCPTHKTLQDGQVHESVTETPAGAEVRNYRIISSPIKDKNGEIISAIEMVDDITESKKMQEKIRDSESKYRTFFETTTAATIIIEEDTLLSLVNTEFEQMSGYSKEETEGKKSWTEFVVEKDLATMREYHRLRRIDPNAPPRNYEFGFVAKDGRVKDAFITISMIPGTTKSVASLLDITDRKQAEEALKKRESELDVKSRNLEELNTALKVLLKQRERDKEELEERTLSNIKHLVIPYIQKLKNSSLEAKDAAYMSILESNLKDIVSPLSQRLSSKYMNLTPKELQVANLIKDGKTTKEIAELLNTSTGTVDFHRNNIRNKLNLKNRRANLRSYLLTLS